MEFQSFDCLQSDTQTVSCFALYYGISGNLWLWFKSYLFNHQQCVKIHSKYSILLPVISGVPQGSILGPLLFLIYINDISNYVTSSTTLLFADDTKCFKTIIQPSDFIQLQRDIESLSQWSIDWNLIFNSSKILLLSFNPQVSSIYTIGTSEINKVDKHSDLGVTLSSNLSWEPHYQHITSRAYKLLGLLRRSFTIPTVKTAIHLSNSISLYVLFSAVEITSY